MKGLRQATVGTFTNFMGHGKINTRGLEQAGKGMLLAATAYNLQKLLRITPKRRQTAVMALSGPEQTVLFRLFLTVRQLIGLRIEIETNNYP